MLVVVFLLFFNDLLASTLGRWGGCQVSMVRDGIYLYTSCTGNTSYLIYGILGVNTVALGNNILTISSSLSEPVLLHMRAHVIQAHYLGPAYLPVFGCAQLAAWAEVKMYPANRLHDDNIMEYWADNLAGSLSQK